jgi:hypothetical protein
VLIKLNVKFDNISLNADNSGDSVEANIDNPDIHKAINLDKLHVNCDNLNKVN